MKNRFIFLALIFAVLISATVSVSAAESFSQVLNDDIVLIPKGPVKDISTKENFRQRSTQMGTEMKVIQPFTPSGETEIYVSDDGKSFNADGSINNPYPTIEKALKQVERMTLAQKQKGVIIYLRGGNYKIKDVVEINAKHSGADNAPLYITNYKDEKVNISSADMVKLDQFKPITDESKRNRLYENVRDKVLVYDLKAHGITEYGEVFFRGEKDGKYAANYESQKIVEPQLYLDDEKLTLSRYPNGEEIRVGEAIDNGNTDASGNITNATDDGRGFEFVMQDDVPFRWENTDQIALRGYFSYGYAPEYVRVRQFNKETNSVRSYGKLWRWTIRQSGETVYYFANVFEELDAPGEWFLDRDEGKLYLYPPTDDTSGTIYLSVAEHNIFNVSSCKNIVFNGLNISNAPAVGFNISRSERILVQNCNMKNLTYAVQLTASKYSGVISSYISGFLSRGIQIDGSEGDTEYWDSAARNMELEPQHIFIQNNYFCGSDDGVGSRAILGGGIGVVISHNLFQNGYNGTLTPRGMYTVVEYNEIVGGDKRISDFAPMYTGGVYSSYLVMRYNYMHDNSIRGNELGRGFYFDEGGSWFECYGNLIVEQEEGIYSHSGKAGVAFNNLFVNCKKNVVTNGNHISHLYDWVRTGGYATTSQWSSWFGNLNRKNYYDLYHVAYSTKFPEMKELADHFWAYQYWYYNEMEALLSDPIQDDELWLLTPSEYYVANNMSIGKSTVEASISELSLPTSEIENNYSSLTEESFADFENHDYRIIDKEALKSVPDWVQIPVDKMGFLKNSRWDNIEIGEIETRSPLSGRENRVNAAKIIFDWRQTEFAENYRLVIARDKEFTDIIHDEIVDTSGAIVALKEYDCELYYKIIAQSRARMLDYAEKESEVFSFWTYSLEEANAVAKADKSGLIKALTAARKVYDKIVEGDGAGQYPAGTKEALGKYISEADKYMSETNIQTYIDEKEEEVYSKIWETQKQIGISIQPLNLDKLNWKKLDKSQLGQVASAATFENDESGNLIYNSNADKSARFGNTKEIPYGTLLSFKYKVDSYGGWQPIGIQFETQTMDLGVDAYYVVIKNDLFELQKYGKYEEYIITTEENNGRMPAGEWNDVVMGAIPDENGTRFIFIANGDVIFDYIDSTGKNYYMESYVYEGINEPDKTAVFAPYDITLEEVMSILNNKKETK